MPNHVINEVTFRGADEAHRAAILSKVRSARMEVDFEVLLPIPLNYWLWSAGTRHEKTFPGTALDWCRDNWGTKWNAYGLSEGVGPKYTTIAEAADTLTLTFQTAWSAPMGWLCALFNSTNVRIEYCYLSEGNDKGFVGSFAPEVEGSSWGAQWEEQEAEEATTRRLHKLLWGVEEFSEDEAEGQS